MEHSLSWQGLPGPAILRMPHGEVVGGLVALHGARDGRARQPLFDQIGEALAPLGVAVVSYDRRATEGGDTPLAVQAADALAAVHALKGRLRRPVGIFGFSQGAWAATIAASDPAVDFLVVLGCSAVSPAEQMRFYTDELLRRRGFSEQDRARNREVRRQLEDCWRHTPVVDRRRQELNTALQAAATQPWFRFAYLPQTLPGDDARWPDMDVDPKPGFAEVHVPVLALWGLDEECVPRPESRAAWSASGADVTLVDLPGCGHWPVVGSGTPGYSRWDDDELAFAFTTALRDWLTGWLTVRPAG